MPHTETLKGRIFIVPINNGKAWMPYKTLVGYGIGNCVTIGSRGEHFYMSQEFNSRQAAVDAAKAKARQILRIQGSESEVIEWAVIEERPAFPQ